MKSIKTNIVKIMLVICFTGQTMYAQFPTNALVGYHENWSSLLLTQAHTNYNVIALAFGLPKTSGATGTCTCDIVYALPAGYASAAAFMADIDALHTAGKKVVLSLGGATGPIYLGNTTDMNTFISSVNGIFATYSYKIDGLDLDLETTSMTNIPGTWTMSAPAAAQTNMVNAIKSIMATYQTNTGKKMLLTMAPEVYYVNGALSSFQVTSSGGIFLPILDGLRTELDMLHMQLYNSPGGVNAWNGTTYYEGTGDFLTAMNETVVKGFTLLGGKGTFTGIPASKIGFGLPANTAAAGSGFVTYADICNAVKYFKGTIARPAGWSYTMTTSYPSLKGLMTWDINLDKTSSTPSWGFATNYTCGGFTLPVSLVGFESKRVDNTVQLLWSTSSELNNDYFDVEKSSNGIDFESIGMVDGLGNSEVGKEYEFTDNQMGYEKVYYRLAQYDFDGAVHYSSMVVVDPSKTEVSLTISQNPFDDALVIIPNGNGLVRISDYSGALIASNEVKPNQEYRIGDNYSSGLYILEYTSQGESKRYKVIKR